MSDYLVQQIEATPNITVVLDTEVVEGHGRRRLEDLTLRDRPPARPGRARLGGVRHDRRRAAHGLAGGGGRSRRAGLRADRPRPPTAGSGRLAAGAPPLSWRPACPGCSRPATSATGRSSGSPRPSARARSPSSWSTSTWPTSRNGPAGRRWRPQGFGPAVGPGPGCPPGRATTSGTLAEAHYGVRGPPEAVTREGSARRWPAARGTCPGGGWSMPDGAMKGARGRARQERARLAEEGVALTSDGRG